MCAEPICFDENGDNREVLPSTQGVEPPLPVRRELAAADACRMGGWGCAAFIRPDDQHPGKEILTAVSGNGWAVYRWLSFDAPVSQAVLTVRSEGAGTVEIWADGDRLGEVCVTPTHGEWAEMRGSIRAAQGVHALYLEWKMEKDVQSSIRTIRFE